MKIREVYYGCGNYFGGIWHCLHNSRLFYGIALFVFGITLILFGTVGFFALQYHSRELIHVAKGIGYSGMGAALIISGAAINKYREQNSIHS